MNCENPDCGKETKGRRFCSTRCADVTRQRKHRVQKKNTLVDTVTGAVGAKTAPVGATLFSYVNPAVAPDTKKESEKGGEKPENRTISAHPSTYRGGASESRLTPGWLDAEPKAQDRPTVTELVAKQIADAQAKADADRAIAAAEVAAFFSRGWENIEDPISQVQILRSFAGVRSAKEEKFLRGIIESQGGTMRPRRLSLIGQEIQKSFPDFTCPHKTSWREPCADCDAGITYESVTNWTVREWRDRFGHICGQSQGANAALSALGMGKWAETSKNEMPVGSTSSGGKLDAIDQASQRDKKIGGKRKKPEGTGPDSYDGKHTDKSAGSQSSSRPDPNYAGKKFGLGKAAGAAVPIEAEVPQGDKRKLPEGCSGEYLPHEELDETKALKKFDKDTLVALKKKKPLPADPVEVEGPLEAEAE